MESRDKLGSRLGFILISAGCAIGIGNVWKFPWMVGQYGGAAFILIYLVFLLILGVPVMAMEFSVGRAGQKSPIKFYQALEPEGSKWHIHGLFCFAGNMLLMMFYTTVAGWMLNYFFKMIKGDFVGADMEGVGETFGNMLASPVQMVGFMCAIVIFTFIVNSFSIQNGIEKITKFMMLALLAIMVILAINSAFLDGAGPGLKFYLIPDFHKMAEIGVLNVIVGAMNQAFFTLSLGIGAMAIFGSYIGKERTLGGEAVTISILDTFVAIVSGMIIFPACFAYGIDPGQGPALIFVTLPNIFANMTGGRIWGSLFFVFMTFAAFSTVMAVCENLVACLMDLFGWTRKKAAGCGLVLVLLLSLPCALGYNVLSAIQPFGEGTAVLDFEDFLVSNLLLPIGALVFILFCTSRYGWGWDKFTEECNTGEGLKITNGMRAYMSYVLPVLVAIILVVGLVNFFS